jgi:tRNA uracil 4-sulfurtransferase
MKFEVILLRYGELSLKSNYVRKAFESSLVRNIKKALLRENIPHEIRTTRGRIYLITAEISRSIAILPRIFGIVSFSPAVETTSRMQDISTIAQQLMKNVLTNEKSFAIRATRVGKHPFSSQDVAVTIGDDLVTATHARVSLNNPDIELFIEIRDENTHLFTQKIKGAGGLPLGTQGRILSLIETPFSLLATWYLMRRGCSAVIVNIDKSNEDTIHSFLRHWYADAEIIFMDPTLEDFSHRLSVIASEKNCEALVTGHSLEDSTSPLPTLMDLKKNSLIPILSPLIAMTHEEMKHLCVKKGIPI